MNRRGSTFDVVVGLVMLVALVTSFFVGHLLISETVNTGVFDSTNSSKEIMNKGVSFYQSVPDNIIFGAYFGSIIVAAILAYLFGQHIIFRVIGFIVDMLYLFTGVVVQMWWETFSVQENFSSLVLYYPKTAFLLDHAVLAGLLGIIVITVALFASKRRGGGF